MRPLSALGATLACAVPSRRGSPQLLLTLALAVGTPAAAHGQDLPRWEVVSIRAADQQPVRLSWTPGRFRWRAPVPSLIFQAYGRVRVDPATLPAWGRGTWFDINATFTPEVLPTADQRAVLLRTLLAERFALRFHEEPRDTDVLAMVLAQPERGPGAALQRSDLPCDGPARRPLVPPSYPAAGERPACGLMTATVDGLILGGNTPMSEVANLLEVLIGRPVIDRTGLAGEWDLAVRTSFEGTARTPTLTSGDQPAPAAAFPSIFTALEEQLGLRLQRQTLPVTFTVIDRLQPPPEN